MHQGRPEMIIILEGFRHIVLGNLMTLFATYNRISPRHE